MKCRHCNAPLTHKFLDLGFAPPSNAYLSRSELTAPEKHYPLVVMVCDHCWLVQTQDYAAASELFDSKYAYFSSTSSGWLAHAAQYVESITKKLSLGSNSLVIEVASNDGYLLKNFIAANIPCLGIEPTDSTADAAERIGIPVIREFFGEQLGDKLASNGQSADLVVGNNVLAHVPDINDFIRGVKAVLKPTGTVTLEFPHLMQLLLHNQFDTVYHEHFSYLSLGTVSKILDASGLRVFDVEELSTHGGSLRVYACHAEDSRARQISVDEVLTKELDNGLQSLRTYQEFQDKANRVKDDFLLFLIEQKRAGKTVAAYGAAAKGNTLLNYAGVKPDLLPFVCDAAQSKQNQFMPGSHIPILSPEVLAANRPDFLIILPWNIVQEVKMQNSEIALQGTQFVTAVPRLCVS